MYELLTAIFNCLIPIIDFIEKHAEIIVASIGFPIVIYELIKIQQQLRISAQGDLYLVNLELRKVIVEHPHLRQFIFEGKRVDNLSESENAQVITTAEIALNYLEHLVIQRRIFRKRDWLTWTRMTEMWINGNPLMKELMLKHPERYADGLYRVAKIDKPHLGKET